MNSQRLRLLIVSLAISSPFTGLAAPPCKTLDLSTIAVGTVCETEAPGTGKNERAVPVQLVERSHAGKMTWKDLDSRLVWTDILDSVFTYEDGTAACAALSTSHIRFALATPNDWCLALHHGVLGVLPHMGGNPKLPGWTGSDFWVEHTPEIPPSLDPYKARYYFSIDFGLRDEILNEGDFNSVRCVNADASQPGGFDGYAPFRCAMDTDQ